MRLSTESIDDTDSLTPKEDSLWDLRSESIPSLGEYDLRESASSLRFRNDHTETLTYASILIDREEYSIYWLECLHDLNAETFFLEALYSTLEFCLMIVVDDHPEFISSGLRLRELETLDMSWMDRVSIPRCNS
jgi:hypothetical protein